MIECEYCGNDHDVRELCAPRQTISRRSFFSLSARAIVGVALAPQIIDAAQSLTRPAIVGIPEGFTGMYGGIERATFTFWRNRQVSGSAEAFDNLSERMRNIYNECSRGTV